MIKRSGPFATAFRILVALPFAGAGAASAISGIRNGQPPGVVFGAIFVAVGVWQIWLALRDRRTAESLAPRGAAGSLAAVVPPIVLDYRTPSARPQTAGELYRPLLGTAPLPMLFPQKGEVLAYALPKPPTKDAAGLVFFAVLWNLFTFPIFLGGLLSGALGMAAFLSLFVAAGVFIAVLAAKKVLGRMKLPRVEVSEEPAFVGDEIVIHVDQRGKAVVNRLQVDLVCRESVTYTVGTDTRTEHADVFERSLVDESRRILARGERWPHQVRALLPANMPASFTSKNNAVRWLVRVRADISGWPDYDEVFELRALPKVGP